MTIKEIRTYKIYTRLNTSYERTVRIQQSYIGADGYCSNGYQYGLTKSQESFMGIHSHRKPKYIPNSFFENKTCQPPIVGIYKKLKWVETEPITKKECSRHIINIIGKKMLKYSNCRLNGICGMGQCLYMKGIRLRLCNLCYYPMNKRLLPIQKFEK